MAEISAPAAAGSGPAGRRGKKLSTRVDLTPMVDLGFLLITFFIFTTTMNEPAVMKIFMPADADPTTNVGETNSLTAIPFGTERVFFYNGDLNKALASGSYGVTGYSYADGIGQVIRDKKMLMEKTRPGSSKELTLIIKPMNTSVYKNVVDILDEVAINAVKTYALTDISEGEIAMLGNKVR
ncbi:MAG: biopolymer transporter ExbD [Chitinophagaceae bacterium]|nr:MAG: biopolymer transporter ExbD [Chitinophagaceae bacterium]